MSIETNKELVQHFFHETYNECNFNAAKRMLSQDYFLHDSTIPDFSGGPETWEQMQNIFCRAFPDLRLTIEDMITEGDKVVVRWMLCGTQTGDLPGIPATGKHMLITGITISRIMNGKIDEQWREWDRFSILQQLGVSSEFIFTPEQIF
jgi:steroid delta-isomerase-like uncharacterized protein